MEDQKNLKLEVAVILSVKSKNIEYLVGNGYINIGSAIPYEENTCNFLGDLSYELNRNKLSKK